MTLIQAIQLPEHIIYVTLLKGKGKIYDVTADVEIVSLLFDESLYVNSISYVEGVRL